MLSKLRARLTYANVMATVAVFIALGGSSYAALRITGRNVPKDALTGADIRNLKGRDVTNNSLTGADVKNLTSGDVANGRLLAEDFAPGQLPTGEKGDTGEPATRLFAYVDAAGNLVYGNGVIAASLASAPSRYSVTFNRSLAGCAVVTTAGQGVPRGTTEAYQAGSRATAITSTTEPAQVTVDTASLAGALEARSFYIAAFC